MINKYHCFKYTFFILILLIGTNSSSQNRNKIERCQFESCDSIKGINFDKVLKKLPKDNSITIIIIRSEPSRHDGSDTISPFEIYINTLDTSIIHVLLFELKYTKGANSCFFPYTLNGKTNFGSNGYPPSLYLATSDSSLLEYLRNDEFYLAYHHNSNKFLILTKPISGNSDFFQQLNNILSTFNRSYLFNHQRYKTLLIKKDSLEKRYKEGFWMGEYFGAN